MRDAFSVLFFVSVGMLFEPKVLIDQPLHVLAVVAIVVLGKSLAAVVLVLMFRYSVRTALTVSASLAQVGEFSFILAGLGMTLGLLPPEGQSLVVAGALLSIGLNPFVFKAADAMQRPLARISLLAGFVEPSESPLAALPMSTEAKYLSKQVVLVGWGRVGKRIAAELGARGLPFVVAEQNREFVKALREQSIPAVWGNATDPAVLVQAHIKDARMLVIATPETVEVRKIVQCARTLNPDIDVVVRSHNVEEAKLLESEGAGTVFVGETELANSIVRFVLERLQSRNT